MSFDEALKLLLLEAKLSAFEEPLSLPTGFELKSFSGYFLFTLSKLLELAFWDSWWAAEDPEGLVNCSVKFFEGGHAKALLGIVFGIGSLMNGSEIISYNVGLFEGSSTNILVIRFLAFSEMTTCSGKV